MAVENVCYFNKFGHCKYTTTCRNLHLKEVCEERNCESSKCNKRHPRNCRFFEQYQMCKFGLYCSFKHVQRIDMNAEVESLKSNILKLEKEVNEKDTRVFILEEKVKEFENTINNLKLEMISSMKYATKQITDNFTNILDRQRDFNEKKNTEVFGMIGQLMDLQKQLQQKMKPNLPSTQPSFPPKQRPGVPP